MMTVERRRVARLHSVSLQLSLCLLSLTSLPTIGVDTLLGKDSKKKKKIPHFNPGLENSISSFILGLIFKLYTDRRILNAQTKFYEVIKAWWLN